MRKLISLITLFSFSIQAATITDDKLTVGKKASASAKEIVFDTNDGAANKKLSVDKITKKLSITSDEAIVGDGTASDKALTFNRGGSNAQVKWNEVTDKLQFSNDGTTFKDLGTGGGGGGSTGVNVLTNDSFEDAVAGVVTDWSNTGGTLTNVSYTNSVEGDAKYFQFVATGAGQYFEMVKTVPTNFNGGGCQVDFKKLNIATADLFKVEALDGSNNVLATGNVKVSSWVKFPTLSFVCPTAGSTFKIRVTSLAAGTLQGDKAYLGSNQNLVYTSQAKLLGTISFSGCTGQWSTASTTFVNFSAQTGCVYNVSGSAVQPSTQIPAIKFSNIPAGEIAIDFDGAVFQNTGGKAAKFRFTDGTNNTREEAIIYAGTSPVFGTSFRQSLTYTSPQNNITFQLQGKTDSGGSAFVYNDLASANISTIRVWHYPSSSDVAVSPEQASWFIDANIGGANPSLSTASVSSYSEILDSGIDLVNNTSKGSSPVDIACASGTASTGATCSSAESVGVSFFPKLTGRHRACFSFSHNPDSPDVVKSTFQLVQTSDLSSAILAEGGERISSGVNMAGASADNSFPVKVCGVFNFSDLSKKTIRLMYEQTAVSAAGSFISANRLASQGQQDIHVSIENLDFGQNRPILTSDQVTTPNITKPKVFSARVSGTSVVTKNFGGLLTTCSNAVGVFTCNTDTSKFTELNCECSNDSTDDDFDCDIIGMTSNTITASVSISHLSGTSNAQPWKLFCHGY